jgi:two-component system sensor histidine kinase ChvG
LIPAWTRSLRFRALVAVAAVVVVPLLWVWGARVADWPTLWRIELRLREARADLVAGADPRVVANRGLRVRLLDPEGAVLTDVDRLDLRSWSAWLSDPLYGSDGPPDPAAADAELGPLPAREEVALARANGHGEHYQVTGTGLLMVAAAATLPDGRLVHVEDASLRLQKSVYDDDRFRLTGLLAGAGLFGAAVALWVGRGLVQPIEVLRRQVTDRIAHGSLEPVDLPRPDELGDLAASFNQLLETIRARNKANEVFAADVAHEIKNPTAAVRAAAEALARPNTDPERLARLARVLEDSGRRIDLVVSRFLELARAEAGLVGEQRQPLDLQALASGLVSSFEADPRHEGTTFGCGGDSAVVEGSPERLETAVRNLLANAAEFSGGAVTVTTGIEGEQAFLAVADRGPGVDPEDLPRVFERYFSRRAGGTGLGLALTRAIVEAHGGGVTAESAAGNGSIFRIRLPRARP